MSDKKTEPSSAERLMKRYYDKHCKEQWRPEMFCPRHPLKCICATTAFQSWCEAVEFVFWNKK
jgi:hypothetical protein